jgi:hypothetical protein
MTENTTTNETTMTVARTNNAFNIFLQARKAGKIKSPAEKRQEYDNIWLVDGRTQTGKIQNALIKHFNESGLDLAAAFNEAATSVFGEKPVPEDFPLAFQTVAENLGAPDNQQRSPAEKLTARHLAGRIDYDETAHRIALAQRVSAAFFKAVESL